MATADSLGKGLFKLSDLRSSGEPAGPEGFHHGLNLILGDLRDVEW
jgi:hypothetical protein